MEQDTSASAGAASGSVAAVVDAKAPEDFAANELEGFKTLSSTKQNVELFKILSAIAEEIK